MCQLPWAVVPDSRIKSHNPFKRLPQSFWSEWKQNAKQLCSAACPPVCTQDVCYWYDRDCVLFPCQSDYSGANETLCASESLNLVENVHLGFFLFFPLKNCSVWDVFQTNGPMFIIVQKCRPSTWLLWPNFRCWEAIFSFGDRLFSV